MVAESLSTPTVYFSESTWEPVMVKTWTKTWTVKPWSKLPEHYQKAWIATK